MTNLKYMSSFINFGQIRGIKWTVPSYLLAKKKQLSFYEGLRPIAALIKEGLLLLRSTIVLVVKKHHLKMTLQIFAKVCLFLVIIENSHSAPDNRKWIHNFFWKKYFNHKTTTI